MSDQEGVPAVPLEQGYRRLVPLPKPPDADVMPSAGEVQHSMQAKLGQVPRAPHGNVTGRPTPRFGKTDQERAQQAATSGPYVSLSPRSQPGGGREEGEGSEGLSGGQPQPEPGSDEGKSRFSDDWFGRQIAEAETYTQAQPVQDFSDVEARMACRRRLNFDPPDDG